MSQSHTPGLKSKSKAAPVTFETVRQLALALPGVEDGTSYRTAACKVGGKLLIRLHQSGESFVIPVDREERELMMQEHPEAFYITDHYLNYPYMLVRFSTVRADQLPDLLRRAWRRMAPARLLAAFHGFD